MTQDMAAQVGTGVPNEKFGTLNAQDTSPSASPAGTGHWEVVRPPEGPAQGPWPASAWAIAAVGGLSAAIGLGFVVAWALRAWKVRHQKAPASRSGYPRSSRAPRPRRGGE